MDRPAAARFVSLMIAIGASLLASTTALRAGEPPANVFLNGVVRDGSGHDWPLYARLVLTGPPDGLDATIFTDPVTGYYSATLPAATYEVEVTAMGPGYVPTTGQVTLSAASAAGGVVANWRLAAAPSCSAPGFGAGSFAGPLALSESFDAGVLPAGWSVETPGGVSWDVYPGATCGFGAGGNQTGGAGPYAMVDAACLSGGGDDTSLITPPLDLSSRTGAAIQFANDFLLQFSDSHGLVEVSIDGGTSWATIWTVSADLRGPSTQIVDMSFAAGHSDVRVRFHYQGIFAYWWQVDDVKIGTFACGVLPGGLVVGAVSDANLGSGLNGAEISNSPNGGSTAPFATPEDPGQPDGFYALYTDGGPQPVEASYPGYESLAKSTTVVPNSTVRLDFALASGLLVASPRPLSLFVGPGGKHDVTLTLTNAGGVDGSYSIRELNLPPAPEPETVAPRPQDRLDSRAAAHRLGTSQWSQRSLRDLPAPAKAPSNAPLMAGAGNVVSSFPTNLDAGWGLTYDTKADRIWISNPDAPDFGFDGDGFEHQFTPGGTPTGEAIDLHDASPGWQADGTYNGRTGMLWAANVGGDYCLFEMDPVSKVVTGKQICGPWSIPQRGLAYDYATDTYYAGGGEATIYHIDAAGHLLDSQYIGLDISGLAYNPTTKHLFLASAGAGPYEIWVLDPQNAYTVLGGFVVTSGGTRVLPIGGGASLEAGCNGRLWTTDEASQNVYEFESGESGWCVNDIPWLEEAPSTGLVTSSGGTLPVTVTFDTQGLLPGLRQRSLFFITDTPTTPRPLPVDFTILFHDVPQNSFAPFIYGAAGAGVMPGCAPQTPTFSFCPAEVVTRRTMAGYIERAVHGASVPPPVYLGRFGDVLPGSFNADYIQGLVGDGITAGCSSSPALYCPDVPVTRAQMAVFVWKGQHGSQAPPECTPPGTFADVPCPGGFAVDYIEGIHGEGVTAGCGGGDFCPNLGISNAQMAVFMVKAFGLPYLP